MRKLAIIVIVIGALLPLSSLPFLSGYSPSLGLIWNINNLETVFYREIIASYMSVEEFRQVYPMYADLDDEELVLMLHKKYFGDIPIKEYKALFLARPAKNIMGQDRYGGSSNDPIMMRGEIEAYSTLDPITKAIIGADAADFGLYDLERKEFVLPFSYLFYTGLVLAITGIGLLILQKKK